jgi:uncharacterized protein YbjT (DUF2867 family)
MKYVITGSIGHISKPLTQSLIAAGHQVTVVTSRADRSQEIKALGAQPAVGSIEDRDFVASTFAGADAVYLMIPPPPHDIKDWYGYQQKVADNYIAAAEAAKVRYVAILSSMGAHLGHGAGPIDGAAYLEVQSEKLTNSNILILRPSFFYYNLFAQIGLIRQAGIIGSAQPADFKMVMVHPADIAAAAAKYLVAPTFKGTVIEYVASDDSHTWTEITRTLGAAIGKPEIPFVEFTDEQSHGGMIGSGLNPAMADGFTQMNKASREGKVQEEYWKNRPSTLGKIKLEDFAKEFAAVYSAS